MLYKRRITKWTVIVGVVGAAAVVAGCAGHGAKAPATAAAPTRPTFAGSPVAYLSRVIELLVANRYASAWQTLNPVDKAAATRRAYVACETSAPVRGRLVSLRVVRVRRQLVRVAPEQRPTPSTAVTFALRLASPSSATDVNVTAHAVMADGRWTWILPPARLRTYRRHGC